jgi:hypothetical protein
MRRPRAIEMIPLLQRRGLFWIDSRRRRGKMPPVSERQRKAMYAAKAGKSTLGIPKKVGAEFVAADPGGKLPTTKHRGGIDKLKPGDYRRR